MVVERQKNRYRHCEPRRGEAVSKLIIYVGRKVMPLYPTFPLDNIPTIWYALGGKGG